MIQNKSSKYMPFRWSIHFLLAVVFLSAVSATPLWAKTFEEEYGEELKSVPYVVRVRYAKEYGQPWSEATYDQRLNYLDALYHEEMAVEMREQQIANDKLTAEMQKSAARDYLKNAEMQKKINRDMAKVNKKIAEDQKKYQLQLRSQQQKEKIQRLRDRQ